MRRLLPLLLGVLSLIGASNADDWKPIRGLIKDQKLQEALEATEKRLAAAKKAGDETEQAKALILSVQLKTALGAAESAVRFLRDEPWPKAKLPRLKVQLFYAQALSNYVSQYGWEIRQRERVEADGPVDLKAWTAEQINAEAVKILFEAWKDRSALSKIPVSDCKDFLTPNNYPEGVRSTLRDALSYLIAERLASTAEWTPAETSDAAKFDVRQLAMGPVQGPHPLQRALNVLDDLEDWHQDESNSNASLEARLTRVRLIDQAFGDDEKRQALIGYLGEILPARKKLSWWPMGMYLRAQMQQNRGDLVAALKTAREGGGPFNGALVRELEAPELVLQGMRTDAAHEKSIVVTHKNLKQVYFRAYSLTLAEILDLSEGYGVMRGGKKLKDRLRAQKPDLSWTAELPATPDLKSKQTELTPPIKKNGFYFVMVSDSETFEPRRVEVLGLTMSITDYVILSRAEPDALRVTVVKGKDGSPVDAVKLKLLKVEYGKKPKPEFEGSTAKNGEAAFKAKDKGYSTYLIVGEKGGQTFLDAEAQYLRDGEREEAARATTFVYTDRGIYRPNQKVLWKVVSFVGTAGKSDYRVAANQKVTVTLRDANYEEVKKLAVTTNAFGSAAGEFTIPAGRLLGNWHVQASYGNGEQSIKVEEYKRPTYEVSFQDPSEPLRLNRTAKLKGEARYYFGQPVTGGKVQWRVSRQPVYAWWWSYYFHPSPANDANRTVATGTAKIDDKGTFEISFLPSAEEPKGKEAQGVTYNYVATADVTDEGGETRSTTRTFRLGFVAIETRFDQDVNFYTQGKAAQMTATRVSLDGLPRPGAGTYRIVELKQPAKTVSPADLPEREGEGPRLRIDPRYQADAEIYRWKDGAEKARGELKHDKAGVATLALPDLPAGAYRVLYETKDEFGATAEASTAFLVAAKETPLNLPALFRVEAEAVPVGGKARIFWRTGLAGQSAIFDILRDGVVKQRRVLKAGDGDLIEIPIEEKDRGGFAVALTMVVDHQLIRFSESISVPWDNKELAVEFQTFRDKFKPGSKERWRVKIKGKDVGKASAEVLAYMYDKSLDFFGRPYVASPLQLFPYHASSSYVRSSLGQASAQSLGSPRDGERDSPDEYAGDQLSFLESYGIGGVGRGVNLRRLGLGVGAVKKKAMPRRERKDDDAEEDSAEGAPMAEAAAPATMEVSDNVAAPNAPSAAKAVTQTATKGGGSDSPQPVVARSNFAETAFFKPQLLTEADGGVAIEFEAPDSVTAWNFWIVALTKDLRSAQAAREAKSVKNLMVRPYLPRFFREGDQATLKVVVNNASDKSLPGEAEIEITDPETHADLSAAFGIKSKKLPFSAKANGSATLSFPVTAPARIGTVAVKVVARAKDESDGELRPLPVLPSRLHLTQSRFVTLKDKDQAEMKFPDLAKGGDPSQVTEQLVVSVDAQLFYGVLKALPYLIHYPYECTEQTMNRFVSTGIVSSVYQSYPAVAAMAKQLSTRKTQLESFDGMDPNRKMAMEESPWLQESRGKASAEDPDLLNALDPRLALLERNAALAKLEKMQAPDGSFPWFPGGPASPYMTLYLMHGFAKATEFGVPVPKALVQRGWAYLARVYKDEYAKRLADDRGDWEFLTFLNYVASAYPDPSWMSSALSAKDRQTVLAYSFKHWKKHSPYLKGYLALTLKRIGREADAKLVFASVMDSAKSDKELGTYWAQEDRSWLWYNDTIESHAFALRTLMEIDPASPKKDGLVQWLFLNKKLSHWKSTRATAEVIYSLVHYLKQENALAVKETVRVAVGPKKAEFVFEPTKFSGKAQLRIAGSEVDPKTMAKVTVAKDTKGYAFASATWSFATNELPKEARGDFFEVKRRYFKRVGKAQEFTLKPLDEGDAVAIGDEVEVQLSLRAKHAAEYVHLRDPRGAGYEPVSQASSYQWNLGIGWYEEVRDSGANFFFEQLPAGEYTFKYRIRATMAGRFRVGPAEVQSIYAPEFSAYSAGNVLAVKAD